MLPEAPIHFDSMGSSPGTILTWFWGDNTPSVEAPEADHAFATDGIYDVTLVGQALSGTMALDTVRVYVASPAYGTGGLVAVITATPSGPVDEDRVVLFDCRDSWPPGYNDALLTCAWDFGDHGTASGLTVTHAYGFAGTYTVRLVVRDAAGNGHTATTAVTVTNLAPQPPAAPASAFGITPAAPAEDETVFFDASGWTDTATDDTALEFDWDFGDGTGGASEQAIHAYSAAGTYTVGLTVRDDDGATATATRSLTVSNPAPTANAGSAINVPEAQTVLYAGTGTDTASDAGSLAYSWTGGTALTGSRPTQVFYDETTFTKTLQVADLHGTSSTSPVSVTVTNRAPYASITNAVKSGSSVIVSGVVHEVGADSLTLTWNWGHGNPPVTETQTFTNTGGTSPFRVTWSPSHTFPSTSTWYPVTLTATDGDGGSSVATASIKGGGSGSLIDNKAPEVTAVNADQTSKAEDVAFSFTATVANPDGPSNPPTTYLWEFGDGATATTSSASHAYARAGTYTVILKATDGVGDSGANSRQVMVTNSAPTASFTRTPSNPNEDDAVSFDASASTDGASDLPALAYAWAFGDGTRGSGKTPSHAYRALGTYTVALTVTDDNGATATTTQSVPVSNRLPTAEFKVLSPYPPTGGTVFGTTTGSPPPTANPKERQAIAFDASLSYDGPADIASLSYSWDFGDGTFGTGRRAIHAYASQGIYPVILTVADEHGGTDQAPNQASGLQLTVDDTPAVPFSGPDRYTYGAEAPLHFVAAAVDDDGEALSYVWDWGLTCVPPLLCPSGNGPDVYFAYAETGVYTVTLTVTDASGLSATDTATVTVNMDSDGDQLSDESEALDYGTDPNNPDSDGDFLLDATEILGGTDPTSDDSDNDGLNDWEELFVGDDGYQTEPLDPDTDGDTLGDGMEDGLVNPVAQGWTHGTSLVCWLNGHLPCGGVVYGPDADAGLTTTNPTDADTDGDGLPDGWIDGANGNSVDGLWQVGEFEDRNLNGMVTIGAWDGSVGSGETDPNAMDTDDDGLADGLEEGIPAADTDPVAVTDPLDRDTDDDGLYDGFEDANRDGERGGNDPTDSDSDWVDGYGPGETDPLLSDSDLDGLLDGLEEGLDHPQGYADYGSWVADGATATSHSVFVKDSDEGSTKTDPLDVDTDDDGLADGWIDRQDSGTVGVKDPGEFEDRNLDGARGGGDLTDAIDDWSNGAGPGETNPAQADTDQDALTDGEEITATGTNPLMLDTDGDSLPDGLELGRPGPDVDEGSTTSPFDRDSDDDGLLDGTEDYNRDGKVGDQETDPNEADTDGDGLQDGTESGLSFPEGYASLAAWLSDSTSPTESSFQPDGDQGEAVTDPLDSDSDEDGLPDGWIDGFGGRPVGGFDLGEFEDRDRDGARDGDSDFETSSDWGNGMGPGETDAATPDTDGDGLPDDAEILVWFTDPLWLDSDGDGVYDGTEVALGTDPGSNLDGATDSDGDGLSNAGEGDAGTDPADQDSDDDLFPDGSDPSPLEYNVDLTQTFPADATARTGTVSLAVDYLTEVDGSAAIGPSGAPTNMPGRVAGTQVAVSTSTPEALRAVVKVGYDPALVAPGHESFLRAYYYVGNRWTIFGLPQYGDRSWVDLVRHLVFVETSHLGDIVVADAAQSDLDSDGISDATEMNLGGSTLQTVTAFVDGGDIEFHSPVTKTIRIENVAPESVVDVMPASSIEVWGIPSWSEGRRVTTSDYEDTDPDIDVDASGNAHLTWWRYHTGSPDIEVMYAKVAPSGSIIAGPYPVSSNGASDYQLWPSIAVANDGATVHIAWQDERPEGGVFYRKLDGLGAPLMPEKQVNTGTFQAGASWGVSMALDASGLPHLAWIQLSNSKWNVWYARLDSSGNPVFTPQAVTNTETQAREPTIGVSAAGRTYIAFSETASPTSSNGEQVRVLYVDEDASGWHATESGILLGVLIAGESDSDFPEGDSKRRSELPSLAIDTAGRVHLAWREGRESPNDIWYSRWDADLSNELAQRLSPTSTDATGTLSVTAGSAVHAVWVDAVEGGSNPIVHYTFAPDASSVPEGGDIVLPVASTTSIRSALDASGFVHLVFATGNPYTDVEVEYANNRFFPLNPTMTVRSGRPNWVCGSSCNAEGELTTTVVLDSSNTNAAPEEGTMAEDMTEAIRVYRVAYPGTTFVEIEVTWEGVTGTHITGVPSIIVGPVVSFPDSDDDDGDGVTDFQETNWFLTATACEQFADDYDGDGLANWLDPDADNDGLWDGFDIEDDVTHEVLHRGELQLGTSPCDADSDEDHLLDGPAMIVDSGSEPGLTDWLLNRFHVERQPVSGSQWRFLGEAVLYPPGFGGPFLPGTDPARWDSDGDGLSDRDEVLRIGTEPLAKDTDGDLLSDSLDRQPKSGRWRVLWADDVLPARSLWFSRVVPFYWTNLPSRDLNPLAEEAALGTILDDKVFGNYRVESRTFLYKTFEWITRAQPPPIDLRCGCRSVYRLEFSNEGAIEKPGFKSVDVDFGRSSSGSRIWGFLEPGLTHTVTLQFTATSDDRGAIPQEGSKVVPAFAFVLYKRVRADPNDPDSDFRIQTFSNLAAARPLAPHAYEVDLTLPADYVTAWDMALTLTPVWATVSSSGTSVQPLDPRTIVLASLSMTVVPGVLKILAKGVNAAGASLSEIREAVEQDIVAQGSGGKPWLSYHTGYRTLSNPSLHVLVVNALDHYGVELSPAVAVLTEYDAETSIERGGPPANVQSGHIALRYPEFVRAKDFLADLTFTQYRTLPSAELAEAAATGAFQGSPVDAVVLLGRDESDLERLYSTSNLQNIQSDTAPLLQPSQMSWDLGSWIDTSAFDVSAPASEQLGFNGALGLIKKTVKTLSLYVEFAALARYSPGRTTSSVSLTLADTLKMGGRGVLPERTWFFSERDMIRAASLTNAKTVSATQVSVDYDDQGEFLGWSTSDRPYSPESARRWESFYQVTITEETQESELLLYDVNGNVFTESGWEKFAGVVQEINSFSTLVAAGFEGLDFVKAVITGDYNTIALTLINYGLKHYVETILPVTLAAIRTEHASLAGALEGLPTHSFLATGYLVAGWYAAQGDFYHGIEAMVGIALTAALGIYLAPVDLVTSLLTTIFLGRPVSLAGLLTYTLVYAASLLTGTAPPTPPWATETAAQPHPSLDFYLPTEGWQWQNGVRTGCTP